MSLINAPSLVGAGVPPGLGNYELLAQSFSPLAIVEPSGTGDLRGVANAAVVPYGGFDGLTDAVSASGDVTIRADGRSEIYSSRQLLGLIYYRFGRTTNNGVTDLGFFSDISTDNVIWTQQTFPLPGDIDSANQFKVEVLAAPVRNTTGGTLYIRQKVMRGLPGIDDGGLHRLDWGESMTTTTGIWTYSPCVEIQWWGAITT